MSELLIALDALHFLRPLWLLGLVPALLFPLLANWRWRVARQWRGQIAAHLLPHLVMQPKARIAPGPRLWLCALLALTCLALAGPAWQREASPFANDQGQLIITLDLSPAMNQSDIAPTRLARAKLKLGELLALRNKARTGLIVYAGSAHVVLPPTDDASAIARFLPALASDLMPANAHNTNGMQSALALARKQLARDPESSVGSVLFITSRAGALESPHDNILVWHMSNEAPDDALTDITIPLSVGDTDVHAVHRRIAQQLATARDEAENQRWQDGGLWLLWLIVPFAALGFRRGWSVRW
jgi:Ca-activated chloride channel homolog